MKQIDPNIAPKTAIQQGTVAHRTLLNGKKIAWPGIVFLGLALCGSLPGQDSAKVIIEATTEPKKQLRLYTATASSKITIDKKVTNHEVRLSLKTLQGTDGPFVLELAGDAVVTKLEGDNILSWAVRNEGSTRLLEISVSSEINLINPIITLRSPERGIPGQISLSHFRPGGALSLSDTLSIGYAIGVAGKVVESNGFIALSEVEKNQFHTTTGGALVLDIYPDASLPPPASLSDARLEGKSDPASESVAFRLTGTAIITEPDATLELLSGKAAITNPPTTTDYGIELKDQVYQLRFPQPGRFPIDLSFAARLEQNGGIDSVDFSIRGDGVMPLSLTGLGENIEFTQGNAVLQNGAWFGFLPADGKVALSWKPVARAKDGKVFFSTNGLVETRIGTGLCRQTHDITYRILQGKLRRLEFKIVGEGEVVAVTGTNLLAWKVEGETLSVDLSEETDREAHVAITTQIALGELPTRVVPSRLEPLGTIRHAGLIRLGNEGGVRIDPANFSGLTQLSLDKFPGPALESRQGFVFRFPAANYRFEVGADRIQPKIHVSEIVRHQFSEGERTLDSAVELDIQDAPIREWDIAVPADYAVVSVTGAEVSDYLLATEAEGATRNLKIIFSQDLTGRRLIRLLLEKNVATEPGNWTVPKLLFVGAESVRGDLGLAATPGFRLNITSVVGLAERPLSAFPGEGGSLQHYFRLREADWTAQMAVEKLEKSVQADVFHLYSLNEGTAHASVLLNYFITGAPVQEFKIQVPTDLENVVAEGKDLRGQKLENGTLNVTLHQPVMGAFTLLVTFEEKAVQSLSPGRVTPTEIQGESGYIQLVSAGQVTLETATASEALLPLDHIELPPEFRLLSASPSVGIWQYNERPFSLAVNLHWLDPDRVLDQVVEFAEATTLLSRESETVTDLVYYVKSRDNRPFSLKLPPGAKIWDVRTNGRHVASRISGELTQVPLELPRTGGQLSEVRMRLGNKIEKGTLRLPAVAVPVLKTGWEVKSGSNEITVLRDDPYLAAHPVLPPSGLHWVEKKGLPALLGIVALVILGMLVAPSSSWMRWLAPLAFLGAVALGGTMAVLAYHGKTEAAPLRINIPVLSAGEEVSVTVQSLPAQRIALSGKGLFFLGLGIGAGCAAFFWKPWRKNFLALGWIFLALGLLSFSNSGSLFFALVALLILTLFFLPALLASLRVPEKGAEV